MIDIDNEGLGLEEEGGDSILTGGGVYDRREYRVELESFEGPLDLLLYLVQKNEMDIHDIPIAEITRQYLEYLEVIRLLNMDAAGDYLLWAATLLRIKARMLLPRPEPEELAEVVLEDPREELVRKLLEYQKYRSMALKLREIEAERKDIFGRPATAPAGEIDYLEPASVFDLIEAFRKLLRSRRAEGPVEIERQQYRLEDVIKQVIAAIKKEPRIRFVDLFGGERVTRNRMIVTFLALLELVRAKKIRIAQDRLFAEIWLVRAGAA